MDDKPEEFKGICDYCMRAGEKASKAAGYNGITLLSPEGYWICESCLDKKKKAIILGANA